VDAGYFVGLKGGYAQVTCGNRAHRPLRVTDLPAEIHGHTAWIELYGTQSRESTVASGQTEGLNLISSETVTEISGGDATRILGPLNKVCQPLVQDFDRAKKFRGPRGLLRQLLETPNPTPAPCELRGEPDPFIGEQGKALWRNSFCALGRY